MYIPPAFAETDLSLLHDTIEQNSFGLLISATDVEPLASHLPFLLDRTAGPRGTLIGHVARANPHWQHFPTQTHLALFSGAHAYISPTWYEAENTVPTWNYVAVHVYGKITIVEDEAGLLEIVAQSVLYYEQNMPRPWTLEPHAKSVTSLLAQIVGFRLKIDKIEGKFKLNQNHPHERQEKVVAALNSHGGENSLAIAAAMHQKLRADKI